MNYMFPYILFSRLDIRNFDTTNLVMSEDGMVKMFASAQIGELVARNQDEFDRYVQYGSLLMNDSQDVIYMGQYN